MMITLDRFRQARSKDRLVGRAGWFGALFPRTIWQPVGFFLLAILLGVALARLPLPWSALLLAAAVILVITLFQPIFGLGLTLVVAPLAALENILLGGMLLDGGQILLLLTLAAWLASGSLRHRFRFPSTPLVSTLALFLYIALATLLTALDLTAGVKELLKWIEIGLVILMVFDLASPVAGMPGLFCLPVRTWWVVLLLLFAGLTQALIGIWQFGLRGTGPEHFVILGRFYRAYGTFEQPNPFGGFVNLTAMLALGILAGLVTWWSSAGKSETRPDGQRSGFRAARLAWRPPVVSPSYYFALAFIMLCAFAASLALVFSWSRGAWLGFAAGITVLLLFWAKNRWQGLAWLIALTVVVFGLSIAGNRLNLIPAGMVDRISSFKQDLQFGDIRGVDINDRNYAVLERLAHWQAALDMARDNLWLGVGFGNYEAAYSDYALINWPDALGHAHNYYLNILAETGVLGAIAYLLFWIVVYWQTLRVMALMDWPGRGIPLGLLAAWTALSVHHLVDKLYVNNNYIFLGVMIALLPILTAGTASSEMSVERSDGLEPLARGKTW